MTVQATANPSIAVLQRRDTRSRIKKNKLLQLLQLAADLRIVLDESLRVVQLRCFKVLVDYAKAEDWSKFLELSRKVNIENMTDYPVAHTVLDRLAVQGNHQVIASAIKADAVHFLGSPARAKELADQHDHTQVVRLLDESKDLDSPHIDLEKKYFEALKKYYEHQASLSASIAPEFKPYIEAIEKVVEAEEPKSEAIISARIELILFFIKNRPPTAYKGLFKEYCFSVDKVAEVLKAIETA